MKYLLFFPKGGLNDMLCNINKIYHYCKKNNRILLINTKINSESEINLSDFFIFNHKNVICDYEEIKNLIYKSNFTIFPREIKLDNLKLLFKQDNLIKYYKINNKGVFKFNDIPLNNFEDDINEDLILLSFCGGGNPISFFMESIYFTDRVKKEINKKLISNKKYLSFQVRNTDYKCDYKLLYNNNIDIIKKYESIYLATDSTSALIYFKSKINNLIYYNTILENENILIDKPLHQSIYNKHNIIPQDDIFLNSLIDLYICINSDIFLSNSKGGYVNLIRNCIKYKDVFNNKLI